MRCGTISKSSRGMLANKHRDLRVSSCKSALIVSGIQLFTKAFKEQTNKRREGRKERSRAVLTFTLFPFAFIAWLADAFVGFWCVLANCIDVTVIRSFCTLVNICKHRMNPKGTDKKGDLRHRKP